MSIKQVFWMKVVIAFLLVVALAELFLLWTMVRKVEPLPTISRLSVAQKDSAKLKSMGLVRLIAGISRLDGRPELLLDPKQSARLVPVVPLLRQALVDGSSDNKCASGPSVAHFGAMLSDYIIETLTAEQLSHLQQLAASKQLSNDPATVVAQLPMLDKELRMRAGIAADRSDTVQSPVRRSLDKVRLRDLALGVLLLEQYPEYRLTLAQTSRLVPMQKLLLEVFSRDPGTIGKVSVPIVEAQVRSIMTEEQLSKLLELSQTNFVNYIDVNDEELGRQFCSMLAAHKNGEFFFFSLQAFMSPLESSREGPSVIPSKAELELVTAVRGIILHLEPNKKLRLSKTQVMELSIIAPAVQRCLTNLLNGVRDLRLSELQGRVVRLLTPEQIDYIVLHKNDPMESLEYAPGENFENKELGRFLEARASNVPYQPFVRVGSVPGGKAVNPTPGKKPLPDIAVSSTPANYMAASPAKARVPVVSANPIRLPLEAIVRGILFSLEKKPELALNMSQVTKLKSRLKEYQEILNLQERQQDTMERNEQVLELTSELYSILNKTQREYISSTEQTSRVGLMPGNEQESALARELGSFVQSRLSGKAYLPQLSGGR